MSSSKFARRAILVAALLLPLAACGFTPVYGTFGAGTSDTASELAEIRIDAIADREGQQLRNFLIERFNIGQGEGQGEYILKVSLAENRVNLITARDALATRIRLNQNARYTLLRGDKVVHQGSARGSATFDVIGEGYGSLVAERDARSRALRELAEEIRTRMVVFFSRNGEKAAE